MSVLLKRFLSCLTAAACSAALGSPGCQWLIDGTGSSLHDASFGGGIISASAVGSDESAKAASALGDRDVLARQSDEEGRSVWVATVESLDGDANRPRYRWHYPALEEITGRPATRQPDLRGYFSDEDPVVVANAAIALARQGDAASAERLAEAVRNPGLALPMRYGAVESLAGLEGPVPRRLLGELIDQYGKSGPSYHARLHAELLRGLGEQVDPAEDTRFRDALGSRSPEVRVEALLAWSASGQGDTPDEVLKLSDDPDARVREAALQTLAKRRHPQAFERLSRALHDHELRVRMAAIAGLGDLGGREAEASLQQLIQDPAEATRCAAVAAMAKLGSAETAVQAAGDESWRVRQEAAKALARCSGRDAAAAARQLLEDPSSEVQRELVAALSQWPLERAGPVLLAALTSDSFITRKLAAEQLAARWPAASEFPLRGSEQERTQAAEGLQGEFRRRFSLIDHAALAQALSGGQPSTPPPSSEQLEQVEQLLRREDVQTLVDFGPGLLPILQQLVFDRKQMLPEPVYRQVLPHYGPEFASLEAMISTDALQRRRASGELAAMAQQKPLPPLAASRLYDLVVSDKDQLVWLNALSAVAGDPHEPSIRLAYAAIGHASAEVRRRACENLAQCPDPAHASVLAPALDDASHSVVCAAARAMGSLGHVDSPQPLQRLLRSTNEEIRMEAAIALARLGDPSGVPALERLTYSQDARIQRRVAQIMGELDDPTFVPTLIRMVDARAAVALAAMDSLAQIAGRDISTTGDELPPPTPERIRRWKQWFSRQATAGGPEARL